MLSASDHPLEDALEAFTRYGVEATFLVPTETGLRKSILDAHESLRAFLRRQQVHDFDRQRQGQDAKVLIDGQIITDRGRVPTVVSLYRPETKTGDPRIWIRGLPKHARPHNLIAIVIASGAPIFINVSDPAVWEQRDTQGSPLNELLTSLSLPDHVVFELLAKLRAVAAKGYVQSLRAGDTGIGYTLETMLGIAANSRRDPDYKGIELKASRQRPRAATNKVTLFSQVPDWRTSRHSTPTSLLARYGYGEGPDSPRLYCTVGKVPNPQGLFMTADERDVQCMSYIDSHLEPVVRWDLAMLERRLAEKHASTFWVKADVRVNGAGVEEFLFQEVIHSRQPLIANLGPLIETGKITLDFTLKTKPSGLTRDHGYLFRMSPGDFDLLFPPRRVYDLTG